MRLESIRFGQKEVEKISATPINEEEKESGNLNTVQKLSDWMDVFNKDIKKALETKDLRNARLHLAEIKRATQQMEDHLMLLSKEAGLPDFDL